MVSALCLAAAIAYSGDPLDDKIQTVLPTPAEQKWLTIPWRTDLMEARIEAQRAGKPMFLWVMNGHPMGCT